MATQSRQSLGIIPACAGSTKAIKDGRPIDGDHPRMCGEHLSVSGALVELAGSSPHVRGARMVSCIRMTSLGIIPACAGSTENITAAAAPQRDHPRMCGEHWYSGDASLRIMGSSPHVRGARGRP